MSYSFLDLAYDVLKQTKKPLTFQEIGRPEMRNDSRTNLGQWERRPGRRWEPDCMLKFGTTMARSSFPLESAQRTSS